MNRKMIAFAAVVVMVLVGLVAVVVFSQVDTAAAASSVNCPANSGQAATCAPTNCPVMQSQTTTAAAVSSCANCPMMSGGSGSCPMMSGK